MSTIVSFPVDLITLFWWWGGLNMEIPHTGQLVTSSTQMRDWFLNTGPHRGTEWGDTWVSWLCFLGLNNSNWHLQNKSRNSWMFWIGNASFSSPPSSSSSSLSGSLFPCPHLHPPQPKTTTAGQTISKSPLLIIPAAD